MRPRTLAEVARAVGGAVRPGRAAGTVVRGVAVDSRAVRRNDLFVALPGERADGHAFVEDALSRGAVAALVRAGHRAPGPVVEVPDPGRALLDLAGDERGRMAGVVVVGITGSTGKTCTKDLTAAVLGRRLRVVASPASFNNEVGLPLTVLSAGPDTQALVCEMGSRGRGHLRLLCRVARPEVGVVTNVGVAHLELFGSREALREAKAELPEALPPGGTAVLNADDPVVRGYAERTPARVVLFGRAPEAAVRAERVALAPDTGAASFDLVAPDGRAPVTMPAPGEHLVPDALAAAAVGTALGLPVEEAARGISGATLSGGRMEVVALPGGVRVLNDAYNANPASVAAALRAARWMAGGARCVAVLGRMAELGPIEQEEHRKVGELVARLRVDLLVVVGREARPIAEGAAREGVEPDRIVVCEGPEEAAGAVAGFAAPGDLVLVKASRVARLERVVEALLGTGAPAGGGGR